MLRRIAGVELDCKSLTMGKFNFGGLVTGAKGRFTGMFGGMVIGSNGVFRAYKTPTNPQTESQQTNRGMFALFTKAWSADLTEENREAWEAARTSGGYPNTDTFTGTSKPYASAKDLFIAMNTNANIALDQTASPEILFATPGTSGGLDVISVTSFALDASAGTVILAYDGVFANEGAIIRATPPVSPGTMRATSVSTKFRVISGTPGASPAALGANYTGLFGPITGSTGQKVFWEVLGVDSLTGKTRLIRSGSSVVVA
jgi:hypothetical protein